MSMPMPLGLVLAAADFDVPCMMSIVNDCPRRAERIVEFGHLDGTPHCDRTARELLLCLPCARVAVAATGPLASLWGCEPPPPCHECGKPVTVHRVTTLRGEPV